MDNPALGPNGPPHNRHRIGQNRNRKHKLPNSRVAVILGNLQIDRAAVMETTALILTKQA